MSGDPRKFVPEEPDADDDLAVKFPEPEAEAEEPESRPPPSHDEPEPEPEVEAATEPEPEPEFQPPRLQDRIGYFKRISEKSKRQAVAAAARAAGLEARAAAAEARAAEAEARAVEATKLNSTMLGGGLDKDIQETQRELKAAFDLGNSDEIAKQQLKLAELAAIRQMHAAQHAQRMQQQPAPVEARQQPQKQAEARQQQVPSFPPEVIEKAHRWVERNASWYQSNPELKKIADDTSTAMIREGGDPSSDEFYRELSLRLGEVLPAQRPAARAAVAPAGRVSGPTRQSTVRLDRDQVQKAASLGLKPEEYLRYATGVFE